MQSLSGNMDHAPTAKVSFVLIMLVVMANLQGTTPLIDDPPSMRWLPA